MTSTTRRSRAPRDHVIAGHWPHAELDGDHAAAVAQAIAVRLGEALAAQGTNRNAISKAAMINRRTIDNVLLGRGWATIAVIADLERALEIDLWPRDLQKTHMKASSGRA